MFAVLCLQELDNFNLRDLMLRQAFVNRCQMIAVGHHDGLLHLFADLLDEVIQAPGFRLMLGFRGVRLDRLFLRFVVSPTVPSIEPGYPKYLLRS